MTTAHGKSRKRLTKRQIKAIYDKLPDKAYAINELSGELIEVRKGESGYRPVLFSGQLIFGKAAKSRRDELNQSLGITPKVREAMVSGSMFGWHVPAIDPASPVHSHIKE